LTRWERLWQVAEKYFALAADDADEGRQKRNIETFVFCLRRSAFVGG
jgi:hypothetical protein